MHAFKIICALIVLSLFAPYGWAALVNGNFEYGSTDGWTRGAGTYLITVGSRPGGSGMFYLQMTGTGGGTSLSQPENAMNAGETWRVRAWIRNNQGSGNMNFGWYTSTLTPVQTVSVTSTNWQEYVVDLVVPSPLLAPLHVAVVGGAFGTLSVDDVSTQKVVVSDTPTNTPTPTQTPTPTETPTVTPTFTPVSTPTPMASSVEFWEDLEK